LSLLTKQKYPGWRQYKTSILATLYTLLTRIIAYSQMNVNIVYIYGKSVYTTLYK